MCLLKQPCCFSLLLQAVELFYCDFYLSWDGSAIPCALPSKFTSLEKLNIWSWLCDANVKCIGLQMIHYSKSVLRP